jgi:hypothetical protein
MFKDFKWNKKSCNDQMNEVKYFNKLIKYLNNKVSNRVKWEEPMKLNKKDKKDCKMRTCELDIFHEGKKHIQYVLGRLSDTKCFINCPNYVVLNISDWNLKNNDLFIKFISKNPKQKIMKDLKPCKIFPIRVYVNKSNIPKHSLVKDKIKNKSILKKYTTKYEPGGITSRELCLLVNYKFNFYAVKSGSNYEDFILLSKYSLEEINKHYKNNGIKTPKLVKL